MDEVASMRASGLVFRKSALFNFFFIFFVGGIWQGADVNRGASARGTCHVYNSKIYVI